MSLPTLTREIEEQLRRLDVVAVYLFGSRARGEAHALSDYDYAVLTREPGHRRGGPLYMQLYELFSAISPRTLENDVIDIVFLSEAPLELRFHVIRYGKVIYEVDRRARLEFESRTTLMHCDFQPILAQMDQVILSRE